MLIGTILVKCVRPYVKCVKHVVDGNTPVTLFMLLLLQTQGKTSTLKRIVKDCRCFKDHMSNHDIQYIGSQRWRQFREEFIYIMISILLK